MAKRKRSIPTMLLWSKGEQRRFCDAVERFQSLVNELEKILSPAKRRREVKEAAAALRPPNQEAS